MNTNTRKILEEIKDIDQAIRETVDGHSAFLINADLSKVLLIDRLDNLIEELRALNTVAYEMRSEITSIANSVY